MRQIATTSKSRKDWELANDIPLPKEKKDHALRGNYVSGMSYQTGLAVDI